MILSFFVVLFLVIPGQTVSWSPDGTRLVYSTDGRVTVVDPYYGQSTAIGPGRNPHWSPVDDRILIRRTEGVYVAQSDGSDLSLIGKIKGSLVGWSPDGRRYAWTDKVDLEDEDGITWKVPVIYIQELGGGSNARDILLDELTVGVGTWGPWGIPIYSVYGSGFNKRGYSPWRS